MNFDNVEIYVDGQRMKIVKAVEIPKGVSKEHRDVMLQMLYALRNFKLYDFDFISDMSETVITFVGTGLDIK